MSPIINASWRFVLARSYDLLPLGELSNARGRTITLKLNESGSLSFNIPMDDTLGYQISPYTHAILAYRKGSTGAKLVWSGYVNTIDEDIANKKMTVNVTGWLDRFSKSLAHKEYIFQAQDDAAIIDVLVNSSSLPGVVTPAVTHPTYEFAAGTSNTNHFDGILVRWPAGSKPNTATWVKWGGTLPNEGAGGATAYIPVTDASMGTAGRSVSYTKYQTNILSAIKDLTIIENGCDIYIDPATRVFNVFRKRMKILPAITFGHGWGPQNIAAIGRQLDGSTVVNSILVSGGTSTTPQYARDDASMNTYGLIEEATSLSDLSGQNANRVLGYYANEEITIRKTPRQLYSFTPFNWYPGSAVPEPFVDYNIGDQVRFGVLSKPRINAILAVRIFGMSFNIDEEGNEKIGAIEVSP